METCKAIVLEGSRKGLSCQFPRSDNGYCGRHQRNFQHEQLLKEGKIPCRFFFRGCNTIITSKGSCDDCKKKTLIKKPCYLCGYKSTKGIGLDRVDNTQREYTLDNVKPCCYSCNILKKDFTLAQVKEKALLVSSIWTDTTPFHSIPV
jgi:hypothetical protein